MFYLPEFGVCASFKEIYDSKYEHYNPEYERARTVHLIGEDGWAEAFSSKNTVMASLMDGIGMGIGFTLIITLLGMTRELLGNGTLFGTQIMPAAYQPFMIFILPPGAFLVIGFFLAINRKIMLTFYK